MNNDIEVEIIIQNRLKRIQRIRFYALCLILSILPIGLIAGILQLRSIIMLSLFIIFGICGVILSLFHYFAKCPLCGNKFNVRIFHSAPPKCKHCGLPLKSKKTKTEL